MSLIKMGYRTFLSTAVTLPFMLWLANAAPTLPLSDGHVPTVAPNIPKSDVHVTVGLSAGVICLFVVTTIVIMACSGALFLWMNLRVTSKMAKNLSNNSIYIPMETGERGSDRRQQADSLNH